VAWLFKCLVTHLWARCRCDSWAPNSGEFGYGLGKGGGWGCWEVGRARVGGWKPPFLGVVRRSGDWVANAGVFGGGLRAGALAGLGRFGCSKFWRIRLRVRQGRRLGVFGGWTSDVGGWKPPFLGVVRRSGDWVANAGVFGGGLRAGALAGLGRFGCSKFWRIRLRAGLWAELIVFECLSLGEDAQQAACVEVDGIGLAGAVRWC